MDVSMEELRQLRQENSELMARLEELEPRSRSSSIYTEWEDYICDDETGACEWTITENPEGLKESCQSEKPCPGKITATHGGE